jgi:dipeptidyl aminopeptidase/acylaminoacyl peptidase
MRALMPIFAGVAFAALSAGAEHNRFRPRFDLEHIVETRTLGQFDISRDGSNVAYTLSGFYYGFAVIPRFGEDNNIRMLSLATGEIRKMTSGPRPKTQPRFSPSGERIAFEAEGDLWVVEAPTGAVRRVTVDLANDTDAAWSPDGTRLAFVSNRRGKTDLWVTSVEGERHGLVQITDDSASESDPQWSPDGRWIAFAATRSDEHYYAQAIYRVPSGGGAPARLTPPDASTNFAPQWSPDGARLAFLSDRSGFVHVWTMSPEGKEAREIDSGPQDSVSPHFPVRPVWSPDGRRILVSSNREGSFDLLVLEVASGKVETVAGGGGQYHEVGWGPDGALVYAYENAWSPPDLYLRAPGKEARQLTFSSHAAFRPEHFARVERVSFPSFDGLTLRGFLLKPTGLRDGERLPAIVNLHTNNYGQFYDHWAPFFHYLAQSGYVILMADQRGSSGYGRKFREAAIGAWGTKTLEDVKAMAAFLKSQPLVDPERVGAMGLSHGGFLTLLALTKAPDLFRAGVDLMGPTDRRGPFLDRNRLLHIGAPEKDNPDLYDRISPITTVMDLRAPLLILHSDRDRNVVPGMTYNFVDELERQHKSYELVVYPDEAHGLADPAHQLDSYRRIVGFFDRHLKP